MQQRSASDRQSKQLINLSGSHAITAQCKAAATLKGAPKERLLPSWVSLGYTCAFAACKASDEISHTPVAMRNSSAALCRGQQFGGTQIWRVCSGDTWSAVLVVPTALPCYCNCCVRIGLWNISITSRFFAPTGGRRNCAHSLTSL